MKLPKDYCNAGTAEKAVRKARPVDVQRALAFVFQRQNCSKTDTTQRL